MTFTYKLSRRLARWRFALTVCAAGLAAGCSAGEPTSPATSGTSDLLAAVRIAPRNATIETQQAIRFSGTGLTAAGDSMATSIEWTASGGSITADGMFSASQAGSFRVIGKARGHNKSDTSTVVVVPPQPTLVRITVTPDPASVIQGKTVSFSATGTLSDGSTTAIGVVWSATGGSIDAGGTYTAGWNPGNYHVLARNTAGTIVDTVLTTVVAAQLSQVVLRPDTVTLAPGATKQFTAYGRTASGDSIATPVSFSATGGSVTSGGLYTAGQTTGAYRVISTSTTASLSDTSVVKIQGPTLAQLFLVPAVASVATGGTVQFQAYGRTTAGDSVAAQATYSATGGSINAAGLYTAGSSAGTFGVIATQLGGTLVDTAALTITAPPSATCTGVTVAPNASIQTAVNNNPAGTTFCLGAGTFANQTVTPKQGNTFIGTRDASGARLTTLDGGLATAYAFRNCSGCGGHDSVTIRGLKITRYMPPYQQGAVGADYPSSEATTGWVIADNEIFANANGAGIRTGQRMRILGNNIHHNGEIGIVGSGDSILVDGDTLAFNNTQGYSGGNEAGGTKFVKTRWLTVRNTYSHDNQGPGLWTDGSNIYVLYESNRVVNNAAAGIKHEISWDAVIRNNTVSGNGFGGPADWFWNAGIEISTSSNVQIYNNTVTNNARGIVGIAQVRGSDQYGTQQLANLQVHDNVVTMTNVWTDGVGHGNMTGIAADFATTVPFTTSLFARNTYYLGTGTSYFHWSPPPQLTTAQWQSYGQDLTGVFNR